MASVTPLAFEQPDMTSSRHLPHTAPEVPSSGRPFDLDLRDLLNISLAVNLCILLQVPVGRVIRCLLTRHGAQRFKSLYTVAQSYPSLPGRLLMEHGVLSGIVLLTILETFHISICPFTRDPSPSPTSRLRLILAISIGRFLVVAGNILCLVDVTSSTPHSDDVVRTLTGHTGKAWFDVTYCVISIVSNLTGLAYGENQLLILTSSFIEMNGLHLSYRRLFTLLKRPYGTSNSRPSVKASCLDGIVCLLTRIILPVTFLGLAVSKESPLLMSKVPFVWFVFCCLFFGFFHVFLLYRCVRKGLDAPSSSSSSVSQRCTSTKHLVFTSSSATSNCNPTFSAQTPTDNRDFLSNINNLHPGLDLASVQVQPPKDCNETWRSPDWLAKSWTETIGGVNYGLLHDNRNLCGSHTPGWNEEKTTHIHSGEKTAPNGNVPARGVALYVDIPDKSGWNDESNDDVMAARRLVVDDVSEDSKDSRDC